MNEMEMKRTPEIIAGEIRTFTASMLNNIIEIGRRMVEVKEMLPHGSFGDWIKENTGYSQSTANNFMRVFKEYGADQGCLFGAEVKSQTFGNLSYSKALTLLALPSGEREDFVETHDVNAMSTRELAEAIAAKKAAEERAMEAERALHELEESEGLAIAELQEKSEKAEKELRTLSKQLSTARETIRDLESRPVEVAVEKDEKAIQEAAQAARAKAEAEAAEKIAALQKKLEKAESARDKLKDAAGKAEAGAADKIKAAEQEAAQAKEQLEAMRRQLAASDKDVTAFLLHSKAMQTSMGEMFAALGNIAARDPGTAGKLAAGVKGFLEKTGGSCEKFLNNKEE